MIICHICDFKIDTIIKNIKELKNNNNCFNVLCKKDVLKVLSV
jgi:hypothetical protein